MQKIFEEFFLQVKSASQRKHNIPHIHAEYQDDEAVFSLDGELIEGTLLKKKLRLVQAWIDIHHDELEANWKLLSRGQAVFKIAPLQ